MAFCTITMKTVSRIVFRSAPSDCSSLNSVLKFSSPTHLNDPIPVQSVNA